LTGILRDFARRFEEADDSCALRLGAQGVSQKEFWSLVHARAHDLARRGAGKGDRVCLYMAKGPTAVGWLFACLLSGVIAVPLDRKAPARRLDATLAEVSPILTVFDDVSLKRFEKLGCNALPEDRRLQCAGEIAFHGDEFEGPDLGPGDPALILMTSGTTGDPKGIVLTHRNLEAFSDWAIDTFGLSSGDRFLNIAPLHFDLSLLDVMTALRIGAEVVIAGEADTLFPAKLCGLLNEHAVSVIYTVPTILQAMVAKGGLAAHEPESLRWVLFAGEPYPAPALEQLMAALPRARFANLFGPTETNVITWKEMVAGEIGDGPPNIGAACSHASVGLRGADGDPVPHGEIGEICVAGPTVMQGYWNRDYATRARYFASDDGVFRTGDYGFLDEGGDIRFTGRRDAQVKLRGNRIELGGIEAAALAIEGVNAAAATVCDAGQTLCLHLAAEEGAGLSRDALLRGLSRRLPAHELPQHFIFYAKWPTTSSGKSDVRSLRKNHHALLTK
jgi:amino acid adenylation domain-containing protein